jgi:hypothetical protein
LVNGYIESINDSAKYKRLEDIAFNKKLMKELGKSYSSDTLMLQGKTPDGRFWKDIRIGEVSIGYVNVLLQRKEEFDLALASFQKK